MILLASDGLFDNVFNHEILDVINEAKDDKNIVRVVPEKLAKIAYDHSLDVEYESPFSKEAR